MTHTDKNGKGFDTHRAAAYPCVRKRNTSIEKEIWVVESHERTKDMLCMRPERSELLDKSLLGGFFGPRKVKP